MTNIFQSNKKHLPPVLRSVESIVAFVRAVFAPLQELATDFDAYTEGVNYDLQFNGQVIYLEHWLNDLHDSTQRRIYISDPQPSNILPTVVYNYGENQPTMTVKNDGESGATARVYNREELATRFDFIVFVPLSIWTTDRDKLVRAQVTRKKQAGKSFTIQTF